MTIETHCHECQKPVFIYVAGPLTGGNRTANINAALQAATTIRYRGHIPFVPHLFELWDIALPHDYEFWMGMDFAWITKCDVLLRLPGESPGADREVAEAKRLGKPVFLGIQALMDSPYWLTSEQASK